MKFLVLTGLIVAATTQPADACGVYSFGGSSSSDTPVEPPPPPPPPDNHIATKMIGGLLVLSVMTRWVFAGRTRLAKVYP